jgi:pyruvate dehydrogenase E2 component (dihydrolipoamide acetyltransferase)
MPADRQKKSGFKWEFQIHNSIKSLLTFEFQNTDIIMAEAIRMPLLSDTMKEGVIAEWHKKVGDTVKSDDIIAEVETDKATMEVMPYVDGTLLYIGVEKGKGVPVNGIMAIIGKPGESYQSILDAEGGASQPAAAPAIVAEAPAHGTDERVKASPLAKRLAEEKGVAIEAVKGSGDNGRIIKRDIDSYVPAATPAAAPATAETTQQKTAAPAPVFVPAGEEAYTDVPLTQMRKIIARRLAESKFSAPHFYLTMSVTMDKAIEARKAINEFSDVKVSFNDLVIKACAMALRRHPAVNSSWMGDFIRQNHHIHIGTAVAVDEGLIVPVVKFADQKSLSQIAREASSLIDKARTKKIQPQEFTGNTFTISNLGMMDIDEFTAIINPPDSCILAVGKIAATPVVENGAVVVRQIMKLTLSCDHRSVDGAVGSKFLQTLKAHLENPVTMLA